jgi:surface protein
MKQKLLLAFAMLMTFCSFCRADDYSNVIVEKEFTGEEFIYWYQFAENQTGSVVSKTNGLNITVGSKTGELWQPQIMVIPEEILLQKGGNYKVVVTAKFPCNGTLQINMGSWSTQDQNTTNVVSTGGFQKVEIDFEDFPGDCIDDAGNGNAHVLFMCGDFLGTTILKKVQVMKKEAYAVLSNNGKTLTFRYDFNKKSYGENAYELNTVEGILPGWYQSFNPGEENPNNKITKMVFDSSFKDATPTTLYYWFRYQKSLAEIEGINYLNTSNITYMLNLFDGCESLVSLDLSHFDTSRIQDMGEMFNCCSSLTNLDISNFNTSKVNNMYYMFHGCKNLTKLNLGSFNTSKVENMSSMFDGCTKLEGIYVGDKWDVTNVVYSSYMFNACSSLKGEKGTEFSSAHIDKEYARIDGGPSSSRPGYLSNVSNFPYDLTIGGTVVRNSNKNDILNNGIFAYEPATKTLFVKGNYKYTGNNNFILSYIEGLTINVTQDAELSGNSSASLVRLCGNTTFTGNGKLTVKATGDQQNGISVGNKAHITIEKMDMDIQAFGGIICTSYDGTLTINSSNLTITCSSSSQFNSPAAVYGFEGGGINLINCAISSPEGAFVSWHQIYEADYSLAPCVTITAEGGITTGVENGQRNSVKGQRDEWYTIDGRKLSGKPTTKGIYLHNGKKVVKQ